MSVERFFIIDQISKYTWHIERIDDLTQCPDDFVTEEEMKATTGYPYTAYGTTWHTNDELIKHDLRKLAEKAVTNKKTGARSFVIDDHELLTVVSVNNYPITYWLPFASRRGNKVYLKDEVIEAAKKQATNDLKKQRDIVGYLVIRAKNAFNRKHKFELELHRITWDYIGVIGFLKTIVTTEELMAVDMGDWRSATDEQYLNLWNNYETLLKKR